MIKGIIYTAFDIYFIAYMVLVFFYYTFHTLPKPPLPITYNILYWFLFGLELTLTSSNKFFRYIL
jgi:hypothetical protein